MNEFNVSFDTTRHTSELSQSTIRSIDIDIAARKRAIKQNNIKSLAELVGKEGCTICPATYKASFESADRNRGSFIQQQLFVLELDRETQFDDVKTKAKLHDLPMLFAYNARSGTGAENRLRVAFLNDAPVPNPDIAEAMQKALMTIFPEADPKCNDISRSYYGGKELLYFDETAPAMNIESLMRNMTIYLRDKHGATNYKRKLAEFARNTGIRLNDRKLLDVSIIDDRDEKISKINMIEIDKNLPMSSMILESSGRKLSKSYLINLGVNSSDVSAVTKKANHHRPYRSDVLNEIGSSCRLYQEFESGGKSLGVDELFGLATNMVQVESGAAKFVDILKANSYFDNPKKYSAWDYSMYYIREYPQSLCDEFCPYHDSCPHGANLLSGVKVKHHQMVKLANQGEPLVSLAEAEDDFNRKLNEAFASDDKIWHIIKAQTAIGKTESVLKWLATTSLRVLIAVPTNKLKHEVRDRAAAPKYGIKMIESPSLHELEDELPDDVWSHIQVLYKSGRSVIPYLKKVIAQNDPRCSAIFKQYLKELDAFNNCDGHSVTTHKRFQTMDVSKYDLVIVDEDIIFNSIIPNKTDIPISELKKLRQKKKKTAPESAVSKKIRQVLNHADTSEPFTLPKIEYDKKDYAGMPMGVDIPAFASAAHFCYRKADDNNDLSEDCVSFLNPVEFAKGVKYIMLSATVDETICKYYFGEANMRFYECKVAENKGTLNQYHDMPMSRGCIDKDPAILDRIQNWSGFDEIITFKKYSRSDTYFGHTAGLDHLKGKNIDVIGTPHQLDWIYKLFASSIGLDYDTGAKIRPGVAVEHNGYRFRFTTYDDKVLKNIQFYMIESELEQAIGRARLLRKDCTVNLFSNFPLRQSVMKDDTSWQS